MEDWVFGDSTASALLTFQVPSAKPAAACELQRTMNLDSVLPFSDSAKPQPRLCSWLAAAMSVVASHSCRCHMQAMNGLEETGSTDMNTWKALLGPELQVQLHS